MSAPNVPVVLPASVFPVELPPTSTNAFEIWEERSLSDGDTRVTSDGSTRVIADELLGVHLQIAVVELPSTVAPVEVD